MRGRSIVAGRDVGKEIVVSASVRRQKVKPAQRGCIVKHAIVHVEMPLLISAITDLLDHQHRLYEPASQHCSFVWSTKLIHTSSWPASVLTRRRVNSVWSSKADCRAAELSCRDPGGRPSCSHHRDTNKPHKRQRQLRAAGLLLGTQAACQHGPPCYSRHDHRVGCDNRPVSSRPSA